MAFISDLPPAPVTISFKADPTLRELVNLLSKHDFWLRDDTEYAELGLGDNPVPSVKSAIISRLLFIGLGRVVATLRAAHHRADSKYLASREVALYIRRNPNALRIPASTFPEGSAGRAYVDMLVLEYTAPSCDNPDEEEQEYDRQILEAGLTKFHLFAAAQSAERKADAFAAVLNAARRVPGLFEELTSHEG